MYSYHQSTHNTDDENAWLNKLSATENLGDRYYECFDEENETALMVVDLRAFAAGEER